MSGRIFSSLALLPTKISVSGFPFRSFVGWIFFGISKTAVCLYHRRRFQGSSKRLLKLCPQCCTISAKNFAPVTGRIISNFLILGDVCKLMTKSLHRLIECRGGGMHSLFCTLTSSFNLSFGASLNCRPIWRKNVLPSRIVYSDASAVGCAAFISMNDKPVSHKKWDAIEMNKAQRRESLCPSDMLYRVLFIFLRTVRKMVHR